MSEAQEDLVPIFMPALATMLTHAEEQKGEPLSYDEVMQVRDKANCIMVKRQDALRMQESRGYRDVDPGNCWHDWQQLRRELGRAPDKDPGPAFVQIRGEDPAYQRTIQTAHHRISEFRALLPDDGTPRQNAMVKTRIEQDQHAAFMWLANTRQDGDAFVAQFFEIGEPFTEYGVGDRLRIEAADILDWMVNDQGLLYGGFSLRYQRDQLPEEERPGFDERIGAKQYAD